MVDPQGSVRSDLACLGWRRPSSELRATVAGIAQRRLMSLARSHVAVTKSHATRISSELSSDRAAAAAKERRVFPSAICHNVRYRPSGKPPQERDVRRRCCTYAGGPLTSVTRAVCAVPELLTQPIVTVSPGW